MSERRVLTVLVGSVAALSAGCSVSRKPHQARTHGMLGFASSSVARPPVAPIREAVDTYFGRTYVDLYRWMETPESPEPRSRLAAQNAYARLLLDRVPFATKLATRVQHRRAFV